MEIKTKLVHELGLLEHKMNKYFVRRVRVLHLQEWCKLYSKLQSVDNVLHFEHGHESCVCNVVIRTTSPTLVETYCLENNIKMLSESEFERGSART